MSEVEDRRTEGGSTSYEQMQSSEDFQALRRSLRRFAFPVTVGFLAWYMLYVVMSAYARGFMSHRVLGNINVAYVFGLLQFLTTFLIAYVYSRHAERNLDPTADRLRATMEAGV